MTFALDHISDETECAHIQLPIAPRPADYETRIITNADEWNVLVDRPLEYDPILDRLLRFECKLGQVRRMSDQQLAGALGVAAEQIAHIRVLLGDLTHPEKTLEEFDVPTWVDRCKRACDKPELPTSYWLPAFQRAIDRAGRTSAEGHALVASLLLYLGRQADMSSIRPIFDAMADDFTHLAQGVGVEGLRPKKLNGQKFIKAEADMVSRLIAYSTILEVQRGCPKYEADKLAFGCKPIVRRVFGSRYKTSTDWRHGGPLQSWRKRKKNINLGAPNWPPPPNFFVLDYRRNLLAGDDEKTALAKLLDFEIEKSTTRVESR